MNRFARALLCTGTALLFLSACSTDRSYGLSSDVQVTDLAALPEPTTSTAYAIAPLDRVEVRVLQYDVLNGIYLIGNDGILDFPMIGPVAASGLTPSELSSALAARLADGYVNNPDVTVLPGEVARIGVSFGGQVNNPGYVPVEEATTLLRGVNQAGGLTDYAKDDDVLIFREIDGTRYIGLFNLGAIQRGNYSDPELFAGDIVMVGDSPAKRRFETVSQYLGLLTTGLILTERVGR